MRLSRFGIIFALVGLFLMFALLSQTRLTDTTYAQQFTPANTMTLMPDTPIPSLTPTETRIPPTFPPTWTPAPTLTPIPAEHDLIVYASNQNIEGVFRLHLRNLTTGEEFQVVNDHYDYANAPSLSPDRRWVVYETRYHNFTMLTYADLHNPSYYGYPLTLEIIDFLNYSTGSPSWSRDGSYVAYHSNQSGAYEIYIIKNLSGASDPYLELSLEEAVQITQNSEAALYPSWSPDGTQLVYQCTIGGGREICIIDRDGENLRRLTSNNRFEGLPSWSPDGGWIAFAAAYDSDNEDLYMMDTDGGNLRRLTNRPESRDTNPKWSRDGARIAFESEANGNFDVCILTLATEDITCITDGDSTDWSPAW